MKFIFDQEVISVNGQNVVEIPFNVWEVQRNNDEGVYPVEVTVNEDTFVCNLLPKKEGYYYIPLIHSNTIEEGISYKISFRLLLEQPNPYDNSPYSLENPIRKIDQIKLVKQPWDGLCGQACVAMLAGITLEEAKNIMKCREWQANMGKVVHTLEYLGIAHSNELIFTSNKNTILPRCAIILEKMGRFSHYLIYFEGKFFDPSSGVLNEYDLTTMKGYLEIM